MLVDDREEEADAEAEPEGVEVGELEDDFVPELEGVEEEDFEDDGVPEPEVVLDGDGELLVVLVADEVDESLPDEDALLEPLPVDDPDDEGDAEGVLVAEGELLDVLEDEEVEDTLPEDDALVELLDENEDVGVPEEDKLLELLAEEVGDWDDAEELEADDVRVDEIHSASRTGPHVTFTPNAQNVHVVQADAALIDE